MATAKRRPWNEMDHDTELLREEIVYPTRTELRGPIPEFLAKKHADQAPGWISNARRTSERALRYAGVSCVSLDADLKGRSNF